ncbi:MAG: trimethylamine methyltransferase family protein [Candidatus Lindowbacteria bacterium]|nr:trimethylamine methyltransferase family protein [Candidatus Lindowbacteria bacterium]
MKLKRVGVLSKDEIRKIHQGSITVLMKKGVKVEADDLRDLFKKRGAIVDDSEQVVRIPEEIVMWAVEQAPSSFMIYGHDPKFKVKDNKKASLFCGLGTPTNMLDSKGNFTPATLEDVRKHIILIDDLDNLTNDQMDIWPNDIPMTTIHVEAVRIWAREARKPFGTGTLGYLASKDTVDMTAMALGGIGELMKRPRLVGICSIVSPLKIDTAQGHGMKVFAEHNQPVPGAPVFWGTCSTIADMRTGNVTLGSFETGLLSAAGAQIARFYDIPSRGVAGTTDSKVLDIQCGFERMMNLYLPYMAGINYITCLGTLERTVAGSHELMVLDNELAGMLKRLERGIEVNDATLAVDLISNLGWSENYMDQMHTAEHFRSELFLSKLIDHDVRDAWASAGSKTMIDRCADQVGKILASHQSNKLSPDLEAKMQKFIDEVAVSF